METKHSSTKLNQPNHEGNKNFKRGFIYNSSLSVLLQMNHNPFGCVNCCCVKNNVEEIIKCIFNKHFF